MSKKENKFTKGFRNFFTDFKKFISRGNIVDMAVGVIIGSAFSAIVTALTNKIIMPLINLLLSIGGENGLEKAYTFLKTVRDPVTNEIILEKSIYIDWGAFITAIINFFLIAFVLFLILKAMMQAKLMTNNIEKYNSKELREERKAVKAKAKEQGKDFKIAWKEHLEEKAKLAEEKKKQEELAKSAFESQEDILKDIRELLKAQVVSDKNLEKEEYTKDKVEETE